MVGKTSYKNLIPVMFNMASAVGRLWLQLKGVIMFFYIWSKSNAEEIIKMYGQRVGYSDLELDTFHEGGHRIRQVKRLSETSSLYSIEAEVVEAKNCNSGHVKGQKFILDVDGNFITKLCPKRMCVYLISQLTIPVALINERLSESKNPADFHFMRYVRCPDVGVECLGYGEVSLKINVIERRKYCP